MCVSNVINQWIGNEQYGCHMQNKPPLYHWRKDLAINTIIMQWKRHEQYGYNMKTEPSDHWRKDFALFFSGGGMTNMVTTCKPSRHYTTGEKTLLSTTLSCSGPGMSDTDTICRPSHQTTGEKTLHYSSVAEAWTTRLQHADLANIRPLAKRPCYQLCYHAVAEAWTTWSQHADQANVRPLAKRPCYQLRYHAVAETCTTWSQHADKAIRPSVKPSCYRCYSVDEEWAIWTQHADRAIRPSVNERLVIKTAITLWTTHADQAIRPSVKTCGYKHRHYSADQNERYGHNMQTKPTDHRRKRVLSLLLSRRRMNTIRQSCCNRSEGGKNNQTKNKNGMNRKVRK